jgi:thiamine-phosphate pyrophosphorylase
VKRYLITDTLFPGLERWQAEMIQVRNKTISVRELSALTRAILAASPDSRVLVNTRVDVALTCGAHGVHLPAHSPAPSRWRARTPPGFLFGVSCHSQDELRRAEQESADFAVYGPVFAPLSKVDDRPAVGLDELHEACRCVRMPVYALGGITWSNAQSCLDAGAAGIAGITLFRA